MAKKNGVSMYSLSESIAVELLTVYGGPMRVQALVMALEKRGIESKDNNVVRALQSNPVWFRKTGHGRYQLNPGLLRDLE